MSAFRPTATADICFSEIFLTITINTLRLTSQRLQKGNLVGVDIAQYRDFPNLVKRNPVVNEVQVSAKRGASRFSSTIQLLAESL